MLTGLLQVYYQPAVYMRDTPGVLTPRIPSVEAGLRLGLADCLQENLIGLRHMADYLLYWLV